MTVYKLRKVGRYNYRKVQKDGSLSRVVKIPEEYREKAEKRAAASESNVFTIDLPETTIRKSRPRYFKR